MFFVPDIIESGLEINLSKDLLSKENEVFLDFYKDEININNNSINLTINNVDVFQYNGLLLSGSLSNNSKKIKNNILNKLTDYKFDHIYRINKNKWNIIPSNIDFNDYDIIVLDNYPFYNDDFILLNKISNLNYKDYIYFLGPVNQNYNITNKYLSNYFFTINKNHLQNHEKSFFLQNVTPCSKYHFKTCNDAKIIIFDLSSFSFSFLQKP